MMDNILIGINDTATTAELKGAFGLPNVTYDDDFAVVVAYGIMGWQGKNWDPEVNDPSLDLYCGNITANKIIYPDTKSLTPTVQHLLEKGGYESEVDALTTPMLNWIGWLAQYAVDGCEGTQDSCFSTHNATYYAQDDISQDWRSWPYQVSCFDLHWQDLSKSNIVLHPMGFPSNRFRRPKGPTSLDLPHQHPRIQLHNLQSRLQHQHASRRRRHQQIRRIWHLLPAPSNRRRRARSLASSLSPCLAFQQHCYE
jgi:hypothetical protein